MSSLLERVEVWSFSPVSLDALCRVQSLPVSLVEWFWRTVSLVSGVVSVLSVLVGVFVVVSVYQLESGSVVELAASFVSLLGTVLAVARFALSVPETAWGVCVAQLSYRQG